MHNVAAIGWIRLYSSASPRVGFWEGYEFNQSDCIHSISCKFMFQV